jgi:hypothetical protein
VKSTAAMVEFFRKHLGTTAAPTAP